MASTLLPAMAKGVLTDNWDDFYNGLETEISKIFANSLLDKNGNVRFTVTHDLITDNVTSCYDFSKTLEEKIVAHADNLAKGSREITIEERMMLIAGQSKRSKKNVWRLSMEMELLRD